MIYGIYLHSRIKCLSNAWRPKKNIVPYIGREVAPSNMEISDVTVSWESEWFYQLDKTQA